MFSKFELHGPINVLKIYTRLSSSSPRTLDVFGSSNFADIWVDEAVVDVDDIVGKTSGGDENVSEVSLNKSSIEKFEIPFVDKVFADETVLAATFEEAKPWTISVSVSTGWCSGLLSVGISTDPSPIMTSSRIESCFDFSGSDGNEAEAASRSNNWSECWKDFWFFEL